MERIVEIKWRKRHGAEAAMKERIARRGRQREKMNPKERR